MQSTKQPDNKTTRQQNNYTTKLFFELYGRKKTCLATQTIRSVPLSRYECTEMQDRFSVFIQV